VLLFVASQPANAIAIVQAAASLVIVVTVLLMVVPAGRTIPRALVVLGRIGW
jgi:hypothetical protein